MISSHVIEFSQAQKEMILSLTEKILNSGQVILGEYTKAFENRYANHCGRRYGIAVGSDTAAFEMQLRSMGGAEGSLNGAYVLYPALAFPSILESVRNAGGQPWFIDSSPDGHLFARLEQVKEAVDDCYKATGEIPVALILMHTGGLIARDAVEITDWCEENGIAVLEDAAHSFGATLNGRRAGSYGWSSAFSLYATKPMHACEGGIVVTDDPALAEECRVYRNYGRTQDFGRSVIVRHGYSWRMTEIQAVVGLANLSEIGDNIARRQEIMDRYDALIDQALEIGLPGWQGLVETTKVPMSDAMKPNGYRYLLVGPAGWNAQKRSEFKEELKTAEGIDLPGEVYELPSHKQPIWVREYGRLQMPYAENFCRRHFALPVYPSLTEGEQEKIHY